MSKNIRMFATNTNTMRVRLLAIFTAILLSSFVYAQRKRAFMVGISHYDTALTGYQWNNINGVEDVDFCLQGLTTTDFISNACCGHGDNDAAYIALKDGRRFILDKEWSIKEDEKD